MYQTRNHEGEIKQFNTIQEAFSEAARDEGVFKISFSLPTTERVRLIRVHDQWIAEDINGNSLTQDIRF